MTEIEVKALFVSAKKGNKKAQNEIYQSYFTPVFRYIYVRIYDKQEAEDIAQIVFLKFFQSLERFSYRKNPLAYFFTLARNALIDHVRARKPTLSLDNPERKLQLSKELSLDDSLENVKEKTALMNALEQLKPEQYDIVVLKFINGYSTKELAQLYSKSEANIRQIQSRALKTLKEKLQGLPERNR